MKKKFSTLFLATMATVALWASTNGEVETYDLYFMGKQVTSANCGDLLGDSSTYYNPATKTLFMKNAYIFSMDTVVIAHQDLTIDIWGVCAMNCINPLGGCCLINTIGTTTFHGSGYVIMQAENDVSLDCHGDLILDNNAFVLLENKSKGTAIQMHQHAITVDHSCLASNGIINECYGLTLLGTEIMGNTRYDAVLHKFLDNSDDSEVTNVMISYQISDLKQIMATFGNESGAKKVINNGQLLIIQSGQAYNTQGAQVW